MLKLLIRQGREGEHQSGLIGCLSCPEGWPQTTDQGQAKRMMNIEPGPDTSLGGWWTCRTPLLQGDEHVMHLCYREMNLSSTSDRVTNMSYTSVTGRWTCHTPLLQIDEHVIHLCYRVLKIWYTSATGWWTCHIPWLQDDDHVIHLCYRGMNIWYTSVTGRWTSDTPLLHSDEHVIHICYRVMHMSYTSVTGWWKGLVKSRDHEVSE